MQNKSTEKAIFWKLLERGGYLGVQFVVQIIMARILDPADYGITSIMFVFTTLAQTFVQAGLTTAIVQAREVDDKDISSVFWINVFVILALGALLFVFAPAIERYYSFDIFTLPFRVLLIILPLGAVSSIYIAILSRKLDFGKIAVCSLAASIVGGITGIVLAIKGFGLWAITWQQIALYTVNAGLLAVSDKWKPRFYCSFRKIYGLFSYGWKILLSSIVEVIYNDLVSLVIGKKYTSVDLAYYNRGKQYPTMAIGCIKEALSSVLLPVFSKEQDDFESLKEMIRMSIRFSALVTFPMMCGLAAVAKSVVILLLTEKWSPCIGYLQISCIFSLTLPINAVLNQGVTSSGRSDIYLRISLIKRATAIILVIGSIFLTNSVIYVALTWAFTGYLNLIVNLITNYKMFGYSLGEFLKDVFPCAVGGILIIAVAFLLKLFITSQLILLFAQIIAGVIVYILTMEISSYSAYKQLRDRIAKRIKK